VAQTAQAAEKFEYLSFRGVFFAEESLFFLCLSEERFLASPGMTVVGTFSAAWSACEG
jgi:hypothetical protein